MLTSNHVNADETLPDDYEQRLVAGIDLVRNSSISIRAAAKKVRVSHETLRRRCQGASSRQEFHAQLMALSPQEESLIEQMLFSFVTYSNMLTSSFLCNLVNNFRRVKATQARTVPPKDLGISWTAGFRRRHDKVSEIMAKSMNREKPGDAAHPDVDAAPASAKSVYDQWFDQVSAAFNKHGILPQNLYNLVELGFLGDTPAAPAHEPRRPPPHHPQQHLVTCIKRSDSPKSLENTTLISSSLECVAGDGRCLPASYCVKTSSQCTLVADPTDDYGLLSSTPDGWANDVTMYDWMAKIFEPFSRPRLGTDPGAYRVLFLESNPALFSSQVLRFALQNRVLFVVFPYQATYSLQPFDLGVMAAYKAQIHQLAPQAPITRPGDPATVNWEFYFSMLSSAKLEAFEPKKITLGWKACGVVPLDRSQVLSNMFSGAHPGTSSAPAPSVAAVAEAATASALSSTYSYMPLFPSALGPGTTSQNNSILQDIEIFKHNTADRPGYPQSPRSRVRRSVSGDAPDARAAAPQYPFDAGLLGDGGPPPSSTHSSLHWPATFTSPFQSTAAVTPPAAATAGMFSQAYPRASEEAVARRVIESTQHALTQHYGTRPPLYYADGRRADVDDATRAGAALHSAWSSLLHQQHQQTPSSRRHQVHSPYQVPLGATSAGGVDPASLSRAQDRRTPGASRSPSAAPQSPRP